MTRLKLYFSA